jgi:hypothetical protein
MVKERVAFASPLCAVLLWPAYIQEQRVLQTDGTETGTLHHEIKNIDGDRLSGASRVWTGKTRVS